MKKMPNYPTYKNSGFEWIRDVPTHWKLERIGNVFSERKEKVSDKEFSPLSVTMRGIVPQLETVAMTNDGDNRKKVCRGDFVINSRSDRRGSSGLSSMDGSVSLICTVLEPKNIYPKYAHYLLRSIKFQEEYYRFGSGIVSDLWSTNFSSMKNIIIPLPPIEEQKTISEYLDYESSKLESIKCSHESLSNALRERRKIAVTRGIDRKTGFRSSEIEWLEEIPTNWKEVKAKNLFVEMNRDVRPDDEIVTVFRDGQVCLRSKRRLTGFTMAVLEHGYQGIRKGDLVLHSMDAFAGAIGVSEDDGRATPEYVVTTPIDQRFNCQYYAEVLRLMAERGYIYVICPSVRERAPRFRYSKFAEVKLPVPPIHEQSSIAEFIVELYRFEKKSKKIVGLSEERFEILATEITLGKFDVRNWQPEQSNIPMEASV